MSELMWRNALQRSRMSSSAYRWRGRKSVCATAAMLLTVGGCSNFQLLDALRQSSPNVAAAAESAGTSASALGVTDPARAKQPSDVQTLTAKGDALYAMGQYDLAQTAYRAAVAVDPAAVAAQVGLGRSLARSSPQAAEAAFLAALKHDPDNVVALNDLGVICDVQERHEEAQKAYRHALEVSPGSTDVQVNLSRSLALSGHADDARELLRAIAADPGATQRWRTEITAALSVAGDKKSAQRLLLAGNAGSGQTEVSEARIAQSGGPPASPPLPSRPEMVQNMLAGRFADPARANDDLPGAAAQDTPPVTFSAPRIAVAQAELPAILPQRETAKPRGNAAEVASAKALPSGSGIRIDAVANAPDAMEAVSALSASLPGEPTDPWSAKQKPAAPKEQRSAPVNSPYVQMASLTSEADAISEWRRLGKQFPDLLAAREPAITTAKVNGRTYWRLRTLGFANIEQARDLCAQLIHLGSQCFAGRGP